MQETQYAIKVRMRYSGSYSIGPYKSRTEAEYLAREIVAGEISELKTQRGSTLYICGDPEVVEVVPFAKKDDRSNYGVSYD